jgi:hypothetical protein
MHIPLDDIVIFRSSSHAFCTGTCVNNVIPSCNFKKQMKMLIYFYFT